MNRDAALPSPGPRAPLPAGRGRDEAGRTRATLIGGIAVLLWALLALFTTWAAGIPPFQLVAMSFAVAFAVSAALLLLRGGRAALARLRQPPAVWLLGVGGLFGYHFFYFVALGNAPAVDASLIAYLWPLLIVVFSALLPGERLRWFHLAGAAMGLLGAALLVTDGFARGGLFAVEGRHVWGYLAALAGALTWSSYSVANRRFGKVPTDVVAGFCGAVALLGVLSHLALEQSVMPNATQAAAALLLGLGPVGAAFFVWDYGTKHGNIQVLGASAYGAPLLSTLLLVVFGKAEATWTIAAACALIVGGALLAGQELLRRRPNRQAD
jgi:drug/metabolite transporter (DMT)-like permease